MLWRVIDSVVQVVLACQLHVFLCSFQILWSMGMDEKMCRGRRLNKDVDIGNTKKQEDFRFGLYMIYDWMKWRE